MKQHRQTVKQSKLYIEYQGNFSKIKYKEKLTAIK